MLNGFIDKVFGLCGLQIENDFLIMRVSADLIGAVEITLWEFCF